MMPRVLFADTFYWISLVNPNDEWHDRVRALTESLAPATLLSTDEVLTELLNYYAGFGAESRAATSRFVRDVLASPEAEVVGRGRRGVVDGLELFERRLDKGYSLTDCISMQLMRDRGVTEVLTHDHHFAQEGFAILFP